MIHKLNVRTGATRERSTNAVPHTAIFATTLNLFVYTQDEIEYKYDHLQVKASVRANIF